MIFHELTKQIYEYLLELDMKDQKYIELQKLVWHFEDTWQMTHVIRAVKFLADSNIIWEDDDCTMLGLRG